MSKFILKSVLVSLLIIIILTTLFLFTGCSGSLEQKLTAHEWVHYNGGESRTYLFFENGTFQVSQTGFSSGTDTGTWEINGNELTLSTFKQTFNFKDIGNVEVDENEFDSYEWYVSDQFLYLYGFEYIAQY